MAKQISVFGGASPEPASAAYLTAHELGQLLGKAGLAVLTGGYMGTMEAVSRGASEANGHVIGVTCQQIEDWRSVGANSWVAEEWRCITLQERLDKLVKNCDAAIALPGGIGTLLEISLIWNQLAIKTLEPKPLILIGSEWHQIMETIFTELNAYIPIENREMIFFAPDPPGAMMLLSHFLQIA